MGVIYEALSVEICLIDNVSEVEKQLDWLLVRKIRLSSLQSDYRLPRNTFTKLAALLKQSGNQLRSLFVTDNNALMITVAATIVRYCTNLEVLMVSEMELNAQFFDMCGRMNGLHELKFFRCRCDYAKDMYNILCPSVSTLLLNGNFSTEMQRGILRMCPNLIDYSLSYAGEVELSDLPGTLQSVLILYCESLRVINSNEGLKKLQISYTPTSDDGIDKIFSSCSSLQELGLPNNWHITDVTMKKIGDVYGKSLTSLDLFECESITEDGLKYVCQKCTSLVHLTLGGCGDSDPTFIAIALDSLPSLRSLNISEAVVNYALLCRIAAAKSLQTLDVTYVSGCTEKGIMALVKGCPSLKLLAINDALLTPLVNLMWKELRPKLRIE